MNLCEQNPRIQDYLDGELAASEGAAMRAHLASCAECAGELERYRRTFASLDRLPMLEPSPLLTERIMDRVLPSRVRRRWVRTVGWSYAGALAALLVASVLWFSQPGPRAMLISLSSEASTRLVHSVVFVIDALAFAVLGFANGWGLLNSAGQHFAPFTRAISSLLAHPALQVAFATAAASCVALLLWMRPREKRSQKGVRHVGVLGF